jgi:hypothetical protein
MTKYHAKQTVYNGQTFHSKKEANYCAKLDILKKASGNDRVIKYETQVPFDIEINDAKVCRYILDFMVVYPDRTEYIDVKGMKSGAAYEMFKLKKRLMKIVYGIEIKEA